MRVWGDDGGVALGRVVGLDWLGVLSARDELGWSGLYLHGLIFVVVQIWSECILTV
jgi:hypothetical protein